MSDVPKVSHDDVLRIIKRDYPFKDRDSILNRLIEYDTETGFDVATAREEGTKDHTIRPRNSNGVLRWIAKTGEIIFSKFAKVKGIRASHIVRDTVKARFPIFQQKLTEEIVEFYNRTVNA